MALQSPTVSGSTPESGATDVVLRPTIELVFGGQSLIDPMSWGDSTFALYGPGNVVLESGPGSILNSGLNDASYPLLGGPLRRDKVEGSYTLLISGTSGLDTAEDVMGTSNQLMLARFTPAGALLPNTEYTAILLGNDNSSILNNVQRTFPGVTSFTSSSGFTQNGVLPGITSGFIEVVTPYNRITQTNQYNAITGQNDLYTITIVSGNGNATSGFKYTWSKASSTGTYAVTVSGATDRHNLGDGIQIDFTQPFASGEVHQLKTYIPKPLAVTVIWSFSTGEITQFSSPPVTPPNISVVIDETEGGGFGVDTIAQVSGTRFYVINSDPTHLEYDVDTGLSYITLEFNKPILSGVYDVCLLYTSPSPRDRS